VGGDGGDGDGSGGGHNDSGGGGSTKRVPKTNTRFKDPDVKKKEMYARHM